jgi:hypothetical protein
MRGNARRKFAIGDFYSIQITFPSLAGSLLIEF